VHELDGHCAMLRSLKRLTWLAPLLLAGCGESLYGAYEASVKIANVNPVVMGVAIIQKDRIIADGQSVKVLEWKTEGERTMALGENGQRLLQFTRNDQGELVQSSAQGQVIYKKYRF
jgi:hypothetical protein